MNIEKSLIMLGIIPTRKFEFNETNYIAKAVAEKLADNILELGDSYNELYMRIYNCNMSYAQIAPKFGNVVYFYPNNTLYFDEKFDIAKIVIICQYSFHNPIYLPACNPIPHKSFLMLKILLLWLY